MLFKVTTFGTNRKPVCNLLLVSYSKLHLISQLFKDILNYKQGLKYNFQGGGTVQLSGPPSSLPGPLFISWPMFQ